VQIHRFTEAYRNRDPHMPAFTAHAALTKLLLDHAATDFAKTSDFPTDERTIETAMKSYVVIEQLVRDIACPPALWMRAVLVLFCYHPAFTSTERLVLTHRFEDFEYAGVTWAQVHQQVADEATKASVLSLNERMASSKGGVTPNTPPTDFTDTSVLVPLIKWRLQTMAGALYSGLVGQFGKFNTALIRYYEPALIAHATSW
jgi:hypothetical protein